MFDRPWPRNSRLASIRCPDRSATALAIEIDCDRVTIVRAKAMPTRSDSRAGSKAGHWKCGQTEGTLPRTATLAAGGCLRRATSG